MTGVTATAARVQALETLFREIAALRMAGIPILNPALQVQAVGFEAEPDGRCAVGVLVTPWFMNLVRLPLATEADEADAAAPAAETMASPGQSRTRVVGKERFDFIGALEPGFGPYEACSLFSPMSNFADHAAAAATAAAVMDELRRPRSPVPPGAPAPAATPVPSRRALLLGRSAAGGAR